MKPETKTEQIEQRLLQLSLLKQNWDSYGGLPVTPEAIRAARLILSANAAPFIAPSPDGGIGIEWSLGPATLIVSIAPSGEIVNEGGAE